MGLFANIAFTWFRARTSSSFFDRSSEPNNDITPSSNSGLEWQHPSSTASVDAPNDRQLPHPAVVISQVPSSTHHAESVVSDSPPSCASMVPGLSTPFRSVKSKALFDVENSGVANMRPVRLVISGRMVDVCAELERLAAQEIQQPIKVLH